MSNVSFSNSAVINAMYVLYGVNKHYECQELIYEALMNEWITLEDVDHLLDQYSDRDDIMDEYVENAKVLLEFDINNEL